MGHCHALARSAGVCAEPPAGQARAAVGRSPRLLCGEDAGVPLSSPGAPRAPAPAGRRQAFPGVRAGAQRRPFGAAPPLLDGFASLLSAIALSLTSSPSSLGHFLRAWFRRTMRVPVAGERARSRRPRMGLFPCAPPDHLPTLTYSDDPADATARRVDAATAKAADDLAVVLLGVSSFVVCGCRRAVPPCVEPTTEAHVAMVRRVRIRLRAFAFRGARLGVSPADAARTGRKGPAIDAALRRVREAVVPSDHACACASLYSLPVAFSAFGRVRDLDRTPVRPLVASRLSYPPRAATWRLADFLHGETREAFLRPATLLLDGPPEAPRVTSVRAKAGEWEGYLDLVDRANGLDLLGPEDDSRWPAGFFALYKSAEADRSITNRIPQNSQERQLGLSRALLAHGASFVDLDLGLRLVARIFMRDLPDCFHSVRSSRERMRTNAVGPLVATSHFADMTMPALGDDASDDSGPADSSEQRRPISPSPTRRGARARGDARPHSRAYRRLLARCDELGAEVPEWSRPAWRTLPMGDLNAVCFVQTAHLNVLRRRGLMTTEQLVRYCDALPKHELGSVLAGLVVDDLVAVDLVDRDEVDQDGPGEAFMREATVAYAAANLTPKESKSVDRALVHDVWGATVDGDVGEVSASVELLVRLATFLLSLAYDGRATVGTLRAVVGILVFVCMFRRCAFALMGALFHVVLEHADEGPGKVFALPEAARVELELMLAFLPLMSTNVRAAPGERLWATDASSHSAAAVSAKISPAASRIMWRHRARRGGLSGRDGLLSLADQLARRFEDAADLGDEVAAEVVRCARELLEGPDEFGYPGSCSPFSPTPAPAPGPADAAAADERAAEPSDAPPTWTAAVANALGWSPAFHYSCPRDEHINIKECRPLRTLVRHLAMDAAEHGKRHLGLVDSSVNIGAWAKGRSRACVLNGTMRSCVPEQLMTDLQIGVAHIRSKFNPADDPTRGRAVRAKPVGSPSDTVGALLRGTYVPELFGPTGEPLPAAVQECAVRPQ